MNKNKTILITGCRGGIGYDSAIALANLDHKVIATTHFQKDADDINNFAKEQDLPIKSFKLDITLESDREKVLDYDIDVLINNAGMGESGSLAEIDIKKIKDNFEVNVFGTLSLTQLVLKQMFRSGSGKIIFISSLAGRVTMPFMASYSMTKFSLSCASGALRQEIKKVNKNIHVSVVEPGAYHTGFNQKMMAKKFVWMGKNSYFNSIKEDLKTKEDKWFKLIEKKTTKTIVKKVVKAVNSKNPRLRYTAPWSQAMFIQIQRIFGK